MARKKGGGVANPYTGGTTGVGVAPAPAARGRGTRNRGGGGNRVPQGGRYAKKAGEASANQDPTEFFRSLLGNAGVADYSGNARDQWARTEYLQQLVDQYGDAEALNQRLSPVEWAKQQFGASYAGKKGNRLDPGSLGNVGAQFETNYSNANPLSFFNTDAIKRGLLPQGGNPEFEEFYATVLAPRMEREYELAGQTSSGVNVNDWFAQNYSPDRANREFQTYRSTKDPNTWAMEQARRRGTLAAGGNQEFADWYAREYAPLLNQQFQAARQGNSSLNFDAFEAGQDPRQARRLFAHRAPQYRQPSPNAAGGGRWSWWS